MSVLFALAAAVGWGSSDFAAGHASRRSSAVSVVILTHFAAVVALVVVSLIPGQGGSPTVADLGWGLAAGLGGGFGAMLLFRGLGKGSMAVVAPITATGAASIPVLAGVIQGDPITAFGVSGVLLALVAIVMVSLTGEDDTVGAEDSAGPAGNGHHQWAPPRGRPYSTHPPHPLFRSDPLPAPVPSLPRLRVGEFPPPLQRASLFDTTSSPVVARPGPAGSVALLERPPGVPVVRAPVVPPPTPWHTIHLTTAPPSTDAAAPASVVSRGRSIVARPGVVDALLSGVGFGLFFVFIARTAESAGHWPLVGARGISVVMFVVASLLSRGAILPEKGSRTAVVLAGALDAAAALCFVLSTRDGVLSVGAVLASLYPAVTIVLARVVSKERIVGRQLVGLALAAVAVSLLAL